MPIESFICVGIVFFFAIVVPFYLSGVPHAIVYTFLRMVGLYDPNDWRPKK
jgi:hypothetical protein